MANGTARVMDFQDIGTMGNHLHLLSNDRRHLRIQAFRTVTGFSPSEMARTLEVHRPRVYREELLLEKTLKKRIVMLVWATDLAYDLLGKDSQKATLWLMAPNAAFGADSPFEVILRGDGNHVVDFLLERSGLKAGAAF